jgi:hypothetical protein
MPFFVLLRCRWIEVIIDEFSLFLDAVPSRPPDPTLARFKELQAVSLAEGF